VLPVLNSHTKVNALDDDIFNMILEAQDRTMNDFEGLVIGTNRITSVLVVPISLWS